MRIDPISARLPIDVAPTSRGGEAQPFQVDDAFDAIPAMPPRELLDEVAAASRRVDELAAAGLELAYDVDPATGRLQVSVRDGDGAVRNTLSPSGALDVLAGAPAV